jgi:hypothetical protein
METTAYRQSRESRAIDFDQGTTYPYGASYLRERAEHNDLPPHDPVPLFLSDPEGEPDPQEFTPRRARPRARLIVQIVAGVVAAAAVAVTVTLFQSDISRLLIVNAKASINSLVAERAAIPASPPPVRQAAVKDPARVSNPLLASAEAKEAAAPAPNPSREAIASAYQAALQTQPPAAAPLPQMAAPFAAVPAPAPAKPVSMPARTLDADTLAGLMTRAKSLMTIGDITSARLLLERAANAQDATAAFLLGQTFDPAVLGTQDIRSINADPATARDWYQKAAQLGSVEARQRLTQLQN